MERGPDALGRSELIGITYESCFRISGTKTTSYVELGLANLRQKSIFRLVAIELILDGVRSIAPGPVVSSAQINRFQ